MVPWRRFQHYPELRRDYPINRLQKIFGERAREVKFRLAPKKNNKHKTHTHFSGCRKRPVCPRDRSRSVPGTGPLCPRGRFLFVPNTVPPKIRKRAEYCFESSRRRELTEPHWVLRQTRWVLRKKNSVSSLWHTNNRLKGTHWAPSPELGEGQKTHWVRCLKPCSPKAYSAGSRCKAYNLSNRCVWAFLAIYFPSGYQRKTHLRDGLFFSKWSLGQYGKKSPDPLPR